MRPVKEPTPEDMVGFYAVLESKARKIGFGKIVYVIVDGQVLDEEECKKTRWPKKKAA